MDNAAFLAHYGVTREEARNPNFLEHAGVKGMKWGHRKAEKKEAKALLKSQKKWDKDIKKNDTKLVSKTNSRFETSAANTALNKKYSTLDLDDPKQHQKVIDYLNESTKLWDRTYDEVLIETYGYRPVKETKNG